MSGDGVGALNPGVFQGSTVFDLICTILCILFIINLKLFSPFLPSVALAEFSLCLLISSAGSEVIYSRLLWPSLHFEHAYLSQPSQKLPDVPIYFPNNPSTF